MISEYSNNIKYAIANCADAIFHEERSHKVEQAIKYLQEALDSVGERPQITEDIAIAASAFHTHLRKCYDDHYAAYLYETISKSNHSWLQILKELQDNTNDDFSFAKRLNYTMDYISYTSDNMRYIVRAYQMFRKEHPDWKNFFKN